VTAGCGETVFLGIVPGGTGPGGICVHNYRRYYGGGGKAPSLATIVENDNYITLTKQGAENLIAALQSAVTESENTTA